MSKGVVQDVSKPKEELSMQHWEIGGGFKVVGMRPNAIDILQTEKEPEISWKGANIKEM